MQEAQRRVTLQHVNKHMLSLLIYTASKMRDYQCDFRFDLFFTARRYASAVLAVIVCLSVCLSVRHKSELYKDG